MKFNSYKNWNQGFIIKKDKINTVTAAIDVEQLGPMLMHEHLRIGFQAENKIR